MKSWICEKEGLCNLNFEKVEMPKFLESPGDDYKVIIKLVAASVNPFDYKRCSLEVLGFPARIGCDILGKVVNIGAKVDEKIFKRGITHVLCLQNMTEKSISGAFSEYTIQDSRYLSVVPSELIESKYDRLQLSCLPVAAFTAYQILVDKLKIDLDEDPSKVIIKKKWRNFVVTGGSGGVGGYTLQMLSHWRKLQLNPMDIKIIAICSKRNQEYVKSIGATHFVDYQADVSEQLKEVIGMEKGVDVWIDMIGEESLKLGLENLRYDGEIVNILPIGEQVSKNQLFMNQTTMHFINLGAVYFTKSEEFRTGLKAIGDKCIGLYKKGIIEANIERIFSLEEVKEALEIQKQGHVRGKLVIDFEQKPFLSDVPPAPLDSILGLSVAFKACGDTHKVNLGVGAYRDDEGKPVVLSCVKQAEKIIFDKNLDNEYLQPHGYEQFINCALELAYSKECAALSENRMVGFQTLSGTGGLQIGFSFLKKYLKSPTIYLPNPTWANHAGITNQINICQKSYRYYDSKTNGLDFEGMLDDLKQIPSQSVILLHACSHNPTGIDPSKEQWKAIRTLCEQKQFIVFFDMAYQGFTSGNVDEDAWALRYFAESNSLVILCVQSFAKNMGLYGQRIGCLSIICQSTKQRDDVLSQLKVISRRIYSNPPLHGARIVAEVLTNPELYSLWLKEVKVMADRIIEMRELFVKYIKEAGSRLNWQHIVQQKGMFAFTGVNAEQVRKLKDLCFIFLTNNGRISIAGLNTKNCQYVAECFHKVTSQ